MSLNYDQENIIASDVFRGRLADLLSFNFHTIVDDFIGGFWGISRGLFLGILFTGLLGILWRLIPDLPLFAFEWLFGTLPVWFPVIAVVGGWKAWLWWARASFITGLDNMLLEVKFPRDIVKSPRAMEAVLTTLWSDAGETTFFNRVFQGQARPWYSFEVASFGGELHFYIWCRRNWRSVVESAMYGQYPEVELVEAEDYASRFAYNPDEHECFCTDWRYEPRNDAYQFRSYVDFELDADPKEEYKIDPFASVLEVLSSLKPSEQMWMQIIITSNRDRRRTKNTWFGEESRYVSLIKDEVEKIRKEAAGGEGAAMPSEAWRRGARVSQYRQTEQVRAMDRNMGKLPFNVGARGVYIAPPEDFSGGKYTGIRWLWRPIANPQWGNQMRPRRWHNPFDYPWQDLWDMRWVMQTRRFFDCYRRRSHFYTPWVLPHNIMSVEAIATLWHPPSTTIQTPGLERIPAKKAEAPPNLPR